MFVYSVRASTLKLCALILVSVIGVFLLVGLSGESAAYASVGEKQISYGGIKTEEDRIRFIESFGLKVKNLTEEKSVTLPDTFDRVLSAYNEIQKAQGLDLAKYKNKRVTLYTYEIANYDCEGTVLVSLYVHRHKIIACDISSASPDGFVIPLSEIDPSRLKAS